MASPPGGDFAFQAQRRQRRDRCSASGPSSPSAEKSSQNSIGLAHQLSPRPAAQITHAGRCPAASTHSANDPCSGSVAGQKRIAS